MRKARRLMLIALVVLGSLLAGGLAVLLWWSQPGRPSPFLDDAGRPVPNSVAEKVRLKINGAEQGVMLVGRDTSKPVLLYLHGGMPDAFLEQRYPTGLEDLFVVAWWDQRGSGTSFDPAATTPVTLDQLVDDAAEVTRQLRARFAQDRIYVMGHSGGTFLGMHLIARHPELFHAYLGVAQMADQRTSEREAWAWLLDDARRRGDDALVRRLEAAPVTATSIPDAYLALRDEAMHAAGVGTLRSMRSVVTGLFLESLRNRRLTLSEKVQLWRGKAAAGVSSMWPVMISTDLSQTVPRVEVPVYFFHGVHDRTCSYAVARAYFDRLDAPRKGFYSFRESAHGPLFEEPALLRRILRDDVLAGKTTLADP